MCLELNDSLLQTDDGGPFSFQNICFATSWGCWAQFTFSQLLHKFIMGRFEAIR
jgi:hypothetical protein